jgi:GT2 family glycosyltransferase
MSQSSTPRVSVIIPSKELIFAQNGVKQSFLASCLVSIAEKTSYPNFEIVLVLDTAATEEALAELSGIFDNNVTVVNWPHPFNFSAKVNEGVLRARGELVLFLNDDTEVISRRWIEEMVAALQDPDVAMVGAELFFEDGTIQHAGIYFADGDPRHLNYGERGNPTELAPQDVQRWDVSGATAACALMAKSTFLEVGGFTTLLPANFNDVDLSLKLGFLGRKIVVTNGAKLYHYESKTRVSHVHYFERDVIERRWGQKLG